MKKTLLEQVDKIIALAEKATARPWRQSPHPDGGLSRVVDMGKQRVPEAPFCVCHGDDAPQVENASYIAAACNLDFPALAAALRAAASPAPAVAGEAGQWVSVEDGLPERMYTANGPAPFSADVLLWFNDNTAPAVGYFDYRAGYECFTAYEFDSPSVVTMWQAITPPEPKPAAPTTQQKSQADA